MTANDASEIRALLVRYASIVDERRFDALGSVFEGDATFGADPPVVGLPAIAEYIGSLLAGCGPTQHLLGNEEIELAGDAAAVRCQVRAIHLGAGAASHLVYELIGEYRDRVVRTENGWRIRQRILYPRIRLGLRDQVLGLAPLEPGDRGAGIAIR